jgi:hypothetical protein
MDAIVVSRADPSRFWASLARYRPRAGPGSLRSIPSRRATLSGVLLARYDAVRARVGIGDRHQRGSRKGESAMNHVLLLTATITPRSGLYQSSHNTVRNRLNDYKKAFQVYLDELERGTFSKIVFAENSASDLGEIEALAAERGLADRVVFLRIAPGPTRDVSLFYLELILLIAAFDSSEMRALPADTMFWKVTGRYIIENLGAIVRTAPAVDVYVNSRNHPSRWTDFYLAAFNRRAFEQLFEHNLPAYDNLRSGEEVLRESLGSTPAAGLEVEPRMRRVPRISGTRGHDRFDYGGAKGRARYLARVVLRVLLPKLWI